ncbi:unnamed protein product [Echinostoma caproni]|uniref:Endo/exonuclease/phosphatase domain-containing protein n=1 Tax=Echinostoma caproni TaxID=27848 RepID=A0A183A182_9TREM|nr:unnamed protein product [Echinostoma caproni]
MWYSNYGQTAHQIDYALVRARWASSAEDCRSYRGSETGNRNGSDHNLVRVRFKIPLTTRRKTRLPGKFNVAFLERPERRQALLDAAASNMVEAFFDDSIVDAPWSKMKTSIREVALGQLGEIFRHKRDWISERTLHFSAKARGTRLISSPEIRILRHQTTCSAKSNRKQYWKAIANSMEAAIVAADFGKLFRLIRVAAGKKQTSGLL